MNITIEKIKIEQDLDAVKELFREYQRFLNVDLCFQGFENELAKLPAKYAEPEGSIFLAKDSDVAVGCIALWKLEEGVCEMKRLYVKDSHKGLGLGRKLSEIILEEAKAKGYKKIKLDTLKRLSAANYLYHHMGFVETTPYNVNPENDVTYFEKDLV